MPRIPELTDDLAIIQKLGRKPNSDDGLTEAGLKAKFDEAGLAIKTYINQNVVPAINNYVADNDGLLDKSGGTMTGSINMNGHKVTGLANPSNAEDAANKSYVDTGLSAAKTVTVAETLTVAGWSASAPYTQAVSISGLTNTKKALVYPVYGTDTSTNLALKEACSMVSFASRSGNTITFTCLEDKPTVAIPITVEVYV